MILSKFNRKTLFAFFFSGILLINLLTYVIIFGNRNHELIFFLFLFGSLFSVMLRTLIKEISIIEIQTSRITFKNIFNKNKRFYNLKEIEGICLTKDWTIDKDYRSFYLIKDKLCKEKNFRRMDR